MTRRYAAVDRYSVQDSPSRYETSNGSPTLPHQSRVSENLHSYSMDTKTKPSAILLVVCCTLLTASSKFLLKRASNQEHNIDLIELVRNYWILLGYVCYGVSLILLMFALRRGQFSTLYPFLALSYFWVTLVSPILFRTDSYSPLKFIGVGIIVGGLVFISLGNDS